MELKISEMQNSKKDLYFNKLYVNFGRMFVQVSYIFHIKCHFIEIDDFEVIFWQKLANSDDVICAICEGEVVALASSAGIAEIEQT